MYFFWCVMSYRWIRHVITERRQHIRQWVMSYISIRHVIAERRCHSRQHMRQWVMPYRRIWHVIAECRQHSRHMMSTSTPQSFVLGLRKNRFVLSQETVGTKLEKVVKKIWLYSLLHLECHFCTLKSQSLWELHLKTLSRQYDCTAWYCYCIWSVISPISNLNRLSKS